MVASLLQGPIQCTHPGWKRDVRLCLEALLCLPLFSGVCWVNIRSRVVPNVGHSPSATCLMPNFWRSTSLQMSWAGLNSDPKWLTYCRLLLIIALVITQVAICPVSVLSHFSYLYSGACTRKKTFPFKWMMKEERGGSTEARSRICPKYFRQLNWKIYCNMSMKANLKCTREQTQSLNNPLQIFLK